MTLLHDGLRMPTSYKNYWSVSQVHGNAVQWTLGALLYRTRYFPRAAIDKATGNHDHAQVIHAPPAYAASTNLANHVLFFICIAAVCVAIATYLRHLHTMVNAAGDKLTASDKVAAVPLLEQVTCA